MITRSLDSKRVKWNLCIPCVLYVIWISQCNHSCLLRSIEHLKIYPLQNVFIQYLVYYLLHRRGRTPAHSIVMQGLAFVVVISKPYQGPSAFWLVSRIYPRSLGGYHSHYIYTLLDHIIYPIHHFTCAQSVTQS